MAPAASHLHKLVVRNIKLLKAAWKSTKQNLSSLGSHLEPIPIPVRARQPLHPIAALRQRHSRGYSTSTRSFTTSTRNAASKYTTKSAWPTSQTRSAVASLTTRTPFASTLRPNLTGGTLNRSAGGYSLGSGRIGGARHFSHTPAAPAQVVQNVSQAVRAFLLSGHKAQFAGVDPRTGEKRFKAVSTAQDAASRKMQKLPTATPGSYIDFQVNPTITALTPLSAVAGYAGFPMTESSEEVPSLNTNGILDVLSADFSRSLKDLAAILNDLKALSALGDLPITYRSDAASTLRVHFPGCDFSTVENLCRELGVKRGLVHQDEAFDAYVGSEIALLFPFAPSQGSPSEAEFNNDHLDDYFLKYEPQELWNDEVLIPSPFHSQADSTQSLGGYELFDPYDASELSPPPSESLSGRILSNKVTGEAGSPLEYQDFEGIYRFIELCDDARR